jgi:hypothetical protein
MGQAPAPHDPSIINFDLLSHPVFNRVYHGMWETRLPVMSEVTDLDFYGGAIGEVDHPHSFLMHPVYPSFSQDVSAMHGRPCWVPVVVLPWDSYFTNILREVSTAWWLFSTAHVATTTPTSSMKPSSLGEGDLHDTSYDYMEVDTEFAPFMQHNFSDTKEHCEYDIRIYPSR